MCDGFLLDGETRTSLDWKKLADSRSRVAPLVCGSVLEDLHQKRPRPDRITARGRLLGLGDLVEAPSVFLCFLFFAMA